MKLVIRHTYDFGADRERIGADLRTPEAWDAARATEGPFGLPETRREWERLADRDDLKARARDIVALTAERNVSTLCSHGVGSGALELIVHRLDPALELTCTDFAPRSAERLAKLFPEARVVHGDLTSGELPSADLHLMHRLDAELPDDVWRRVFAGLPEPVIFVPNVLLDVPTLLRELGRRLRTRRLTQAGWFRNEDALRALWQETHSDRLVRVGDSPAFVLEPREVEERDVHQ